MTVGHLSTTVHTRQKTVAVLAFVSLSVLITSGLTTQASKDKNSKVKLPQELLFLGWIVGGCETKVNVVCRTIRIAEDTNDTSRILR